MSSALVIYCGGRKSSKVTAGRLIERARMRAGSLRSIYGISSGVGASQEGVVNSPVIVTLRRGAAGTDTGFRTPYDSPGSFW
jgi:hypothetical protein